MRVLVFHGYLLHGTGSNVYNANLAAALARLGHEVHLLCQDRAPEDLSFVDAIGDWETGVLRVHVLREPVRCTVYRPDLGGLLPVYVADRYEGLEARPFPELDERQVASYVERNVAAVREVAERARPDVALANHLIMGPLILARGLSGLGVPYAVKVHGSALEYTVKPHPRFLPAAREGIAGASAVLVGSRHTAESLWDALDDPDLPARTRLGPPGVDIYAFTPRGPDEARAGLHRLAERLATAAASAPVAGAGSGFAADPAAAAAALAAVDPAADRLVAFVGKLIVSKGVDLLLAAWPLVLADVPAARLVVVGFGAYGDALARLARDLAAGDLAAVRRLAEQGRAAEGGPRGRLDHLLAFLDGLDGTALDGYRAAARGLTERVLFTGRLDHRDLADLLPACEAQVVPSTFPEAFGMVAAEAAACGTLPICARHSGLLEVADALADAVPQAARDWLAFPVGPRSVPEIAERVIAWLQAPAPLRTATRAALAETAHARWSWEGVAAGVLAAAAGRLGELPSP